MGEPLAITDGKPVIDTGSYWDYISLAPVYNITSSTGSLVYRSAATVANFSYDTIASVGEYVGSLIPGKQMKTVAYYTMKTVVKVVRTYAVIQVAVIAAPYLLPYLAGRIVTTWALPTTRPFFQIFESAAIMTFMLPSIGITLVSELFFRHAFKEQYTSSCPPLRVNREKEIADSLKTLGIYDEVMKNKSEEVLKDPEKLQLSQRQIRNAVKPLWLRHHPDRGGDPEMFKKVQNAKDTLEDFVV